jgi:hypothetical protein
MWCPLNIFEAAASHEHTKRYTCIGYILSGLPEGYSRKKSPLGSFAVLLKYLNGRYNAYMHREARMYM